DTRKAMLYMLEDLEDSRQVIEQAKQEWVQTFDAVPDPIFLHDMEGRVVRANLAYADKAGISIEKVIGQLYWQLFPRGPGPMPCCPLAPSGDEGSPGHELRLDSGETYICRSFSFRSRGDATTFTAHMLQDVTERRVMDETRKRFEFIADASQDFMNLIDRNYVYEAANDAFVKAHGATRQEIIGKTVGQIWGKKVFESEIRQHLDLCFAGEVTHYESSLKIAGKSLRDFETILYPYRNPQGDVTHAVVVSRDITERKKAEMELEKSCVRLEHALTGTITAIATTVEARDPYTAGHQRRVAKIASTIAEQLGLGDDQIEGINMGAMIHDIGKIHLPAEILAKPTKLTDTEYEMIKGHSQVGYDILKGIDFPWPVADIAHQHHERLDGSGYPQGLKGDEICLEAKIVAVADVVEAIASHRPYRASLGIDFALQEISDKKGKFYCPDAVDACLKLFREDGFTLDSETVQA
ncbi:MAG: HD domain-containing phosphohydrolase, partial [Mariprofundaceae bacterium]